MSLTTGGYCTVKEKSDNVEDVYTLQPVSFEPGMRWTVMTKLLAAAMIVLPTLIILNVVLIVLNNRRRRIAK